MMRGLKFLPLILVMGLAWFLFFSEQGAQWLAQMAARDGKGGIALGRVVRASGTFKRIHGGGVEIFTGPVNSPIELHDGDRLETDKGAEVLLALNSQDELTLPGLSAVRIELWNTQDQNSPIYLYSTFGEVKSTKAGVKGRAYLVRDGKLYFPGQTPANKPLALTVLRSAPIDMQLADAGKENVQPQEDFAPDTEPDDTPAEAPPMPAGRESDTLSNEYIDEMIVTRQAQLQKCWFGRLKDNPKLHGQILLQFEISRRGKVRDLRVSDSSIKDELLQRCVLAVVERIPFRPYRGQEISLSYPITFE